MGNTDPKGAYIRAPIFKGKNYAYWKETIYIHLMFVDKIPLVETTNICSIPKNKIDDFVKLPKYWSKEETKKASYDLKAGNVLICVLRDIVFYSISLDKRAQSMWNTLHVL